MGFKMKGKILILLIALFAVLMCSTVAAVDIDNAHIEKERYEHTDADGNVDKATNYYIKFNLKDTKNYKAKIIALDKDNKVINTKEVTIKNGENSFDLPKENVNGVNIIISEGDKVIYNKTTTEIKETSNVTSEPKKETSSAEYWASEKSDKFHNPGCEWAQKISSKNKVVFHSRDEAISAGYNPCSVCNP